MDINTLKIDDIKNRLANSLGSQITNHYPDSILEGPARPAAVLLPLINQNNTWHLLYIRRTEIPGDLHSGQVAFPGGAKDDQDLTIEAAAVREANEEIGLDSSDVNILGRMSEFITISNYQVTPFVGVIPWPYSLTPSPDEVSRIFSIPLSWLGDSSNYEELERVLPDNSVVSVIYFKEYDKEILWGATARITIEFLKILNLIK